MDRLLNLARKTESLPALPYTASAMPFGVPLMLIVSSPPSRSMPRPSSPVKAEKSAELAGMPVMPEAVTVMLSAFALAACTKKSSSLAEPLSAMATGPSSAVGSTSQ